MAPLGGYDTTLGQTIRDRRTALKISQAAVAAALSVSKPVLRRVEQGLTSLPAADLVRVAALLDLDLHDLLQEPRIRERSDESRLVSAWLTIDNGKDREAVLAFLHALSHASA